MVGYSRHFKVQDIPKEFIVLLIGGHKEIYDICCKVQD